jgi:hypothetical protein
VIPKFRHYSIKFYTINMPLEKDFSIGKLKIALIVYIVGSMTPYIIILQVVR